MTYSDPKINPDAPTTTGPEGNPEADLNAASSPSGDLGPSSDSQERFKRLTEILWTTELKESPLERRDPRTGAYFPELIKSDRGVELLRQQLPSMLLCFIDKDNVGVLSDVGLKSLADYLFEKEKEVFEKSFSEQDRFIRYAGDEFIYLTSDDKRGRQAIETALVELAKVRDFVIRDMAADTRTYFGTGSREALSGKISEAQKLAVLQKTMSGISALYKTTTKGPRTPAGLADWLIDKVGSDIRNDWMASKNIRPGVRTFAEAWLCTDQPMEKLAHEFQAFVAYSISKRLFDGKDERPRGMAEDIFRIATVAKDTQLFGVSSAKVSVDNEGTYTALDIKRAINEAEKLIHKSKICIPVDLLTVHKRDPLAKERAIDAIDIDATNRQVETYFEVKETIADPDIPAPMKLHLKKQALDLLCADTGCPEAYRLSRVSGQKTRAFLEFSKDSAMGSSIRFKIPGFGAFNKQLRMELADAVFTEVMTTFKDEITRQFPVESKNAMFIREGGGSAAVIFGSAVEISAFSKHEISQKLSEIFASKITDLTRLSFYEKQAFKDFASASDEFPSVVAREGGPHEISEVLISDKQGMIWPNMSVRETYSVFWPKDAV
jgi:GGDEF domain-containing protein